MQMNDGGNFGDDPMIRFLAKMQKGSVSEDDMQKQEQMKHDAINSAMGTIGSMKMVPGIAGIAAEAAPAEMGLADKIRQAAQNSKVQGPEGGITNNASMYQKGLAQPEKSYFDLAREKLGGQSITSADELATRQAQQRMRDEAIKQRNFEQINSLLNKK